MSEILVLCYHAVSPSWDSPLAIAPATLERQVSSRLARGYRAVTFGEAVRAAAAAAKGDKRAEGAKGDKRAEGAKGAKRAESAGDRLLAVTFDDAYLSVLELGLPVLARLGVPATVFVPTDFPDSGAPMVWPGIDRWRSGPHERELTPMSWEQLGGLTEHGWEIGSHSCSHPRLTSLDDGGLARELTRSKQACEARLGQPCVAVAYPYGDVDERVVRAASAAGYVAGAALPARPHADSAMRWPRVGVYGVDVPWRFALKTSPVLRRVRTASRWGRSR